MKKKAIAAFMAATTLLGSMTNIALAEGDQDIYDLNMQIITWGTVPAGLEAVEDAINAVTEPEIGVRVTLEPVAAWDLPSESSLAITSGEKIDIMCILPYGGGLDYVTNYTDKNMLTEISDLYAEYGQDIAACLSEDMLSLGKVGDELYAIPCNVVQGSTPCFTARTDVLDELGITIDENKVYSLEELEEMFDAYKAKYGDGNYCVATFGGGDMYNAIYRVDNLGTDTADGVLIGAGLDGDTTVVDLFETQEYADFCARMKEWYDKGYYSPDVTSITDGSTQLLAQGNYFGTFGAVVPGSGFEIMKANCGYDLTIIKTAEPYITSGMAALALWGIPVTSENPEKAMQFLNMLYQERELEEDIDTMITMGLEGQDYVVLEKQEGSKAIVTYPEGFDANTVPYPYAVSAYGNSLTIPQYDPLTADIYDTFEEYSANSEKSLAFGYIYNSSNVQMQKAAISSVINQYMPILSVGCVDPDEVLPEFIQALKDAGIDEVIADNQAQLDAWLAAR